MCARFLDWWIEAVVNGKPWPDRYDMVDVQFHLGSAKPKTVPNDRSVAPKSGKKTPKQHLKSGPSAGNART
jgi:hypothetical protein